jgi:hypothetical protein
MAKLHELLAVDSNLKGQSGKCRAELQTTMEKKRHLFQEKLVTFTPKGENQESVTTEQSALNTTMRAEVEWLSKILAKAIDCSYAIDNANTVARGDIRIDDGTVDGTVLAKDVPTTALLQLEHRVKEILDFAKQIPTLDPAKGFEPDAPRGKGIYKARPVTKERTKKVEEFIVVVQATKEHPAQVAKETKDIVVGTIEELEWVAFITPADKADILERGEALLRAVTQARSRANAQEIDAGGYKIGKKLLDYVFQPLMT